MLYPLFAMVILTFVVALFTLYIRINATRTGELHLRYFKLMQGADLPEPVAKTTRHFSNLFEMPVLFYTAGAIYLGLGIQSEAAELTAWLFVAFRCIHTLIHLGYNNVMHRLIAFMAGNVCILVLWIQLIMAQA